MKKFSFVAFIFSFVFSACSSSTSTTNSNVNYKAREQQNVAYSTERANSMMSNASTSADMKSAKSEEKQARNFEDEIDGERYAKIDENPFLETVRTPLSTFSIDVDTASYANVRRYLNDGQLPPKDAIRIEELISIILNTITRSRLATFHFR